MRPATVRRGALAVPAVIIAVIVLTAWPAQASPARAGTVSVTIDAISPQVAGPGATVTVAGTISNGTGQTQAGLEVQVYTSPMPFRSRDDMDAYLARGLDNLEPAGQPSGPPASVAPGATASWRASFQASAAGMAEFGVYPVTVLVQDPAGDLLAVGHELLPFWPGQRAAGLRSPLRISWLWPLVDQPYHQACPALTSNALAPSLAPGGRLSALLAAGASHPGADVTWVIDPALLGDVATMTHPYQVGGKPGCTGAAGKRAGVAAARWLAALKKAVPAQPAVITPYANVDMTALVHQGLTGDLAAAYQTGDALAGTVLGGKFGHSLAWPAGGTADLSLLTYLATAEHVTTVVLNSTEMPPSDAAVFGDDAVTSLTVAGLPVNVLLADDTLTSVLRPAGTGSPAFAVKQRFLAETAMIAAQLPGSARTLVVAPPEDWNPSQALAGDLLGETTAAPWLAPTALGQLSSAPDSERTVARQAPPASKASPGELGRAYLSRVNAIGARLGVYKSMLYQPGPSYSPSLTEALAATESAAWRGGRWPAGAALAGRLSGYLNSAEKKVKLIVSAQVAMGGTSGEIPMSIQNGLSQAIRVRVVASVSDAPQGSSQLTVSSSPGLVVVQPQTTPPVRLRVSSAPPGATDIQLRLVSANGTPLPFAAAKLTVVSTRSGRVILVLIAAAIGVLVLTSAYRGVRRWLRGDTRAASEQAELPGSVEGGTSGARHPTEAQHDLAEARRRVDDA